MMANNTITAAKGFLTAGLSCKIKASGKHDLGLIVCPAGARAAAVFTTNKIVAAPVMISRKHIMSKEVYGVVVNSGNANACTGTKGLNNAVTMCRLLAKQIDAGPHQVLVASTGIIGEQLPMTKVRAGIKIAAKELSASPEAGLNFTKAIMTTDTKPKHSVRRVKIGNKEITLAGTIKGAGMIGPNMATTLCFLTTDAVIGKGALSRALKEAIDGSINKLTVDGHQSTNDTAMILASGAAGNRIITTLGYGYSKFAGAVSEVCEDLVTQMALDAEGATRMFKVVVTGAAKKLDARKVARAVADYDLVKCAVHGADPNWGRIICAVGNCDVKLDIKKLSCKIGNTVVFRNGQPAKFNAKAVSRIIAKKQHTITIDLGVGKADDYCYGCDLSKEYVTINADYHT